MAFDGSAFVILGGAGGIGRETAARLLAAGAQVLIAGRSAETIAAAGASLGCEHQQLDATDVEAVEVCIEGFAQRQGRLDGVANCVGSLILKPAHLTTAEDWDRTMATNLRSAFAAVRASAKVMRKEGGSVVLFSSAAAQIGLANHEAIAAAKAGVAGLALSAAATYAPAKIRVNAISPGLTKTQLTQSIWSRDAAAKASEEMHALGRLGEPGDVASLAVWLLDPANSWITGQVIAVDGGLSRLRTAPRRG